MSSTKKEYSSNTPHSKEAQERCIEMMHLSYFQVRKYFRNKVNNYPRFLYRYLKSDTQNDWLEDQIINSDYRLSSPRSFNDPFDMKAKVIVTGSIRSQRKRIERLIKDKEPHLTKEQQEAKVIKMLRSGTFTEAGLNQILNSNLDKAGVLCFSKDPRNILMWSHYGSEHKGIVMQFNTARDPEIFAGAIPVSYPTDDIYPIYDWFSGPDNQMQSILTRKHSGWSYENEHRILRIGDADKYMRVNHRALSGVILGCRADDQFNKKIDLILKKRIDLGFPKVRKFKATMDDSQYRIKIFESD